jgi:hypothetical protein
MSNLPELKSWDAALESIIPPVTPEKYTLLFENVGCVVEDPVLDIFSPDELLSLHSDTLSEVIVILL